MNCRQAERYLPGYLDGAISSRQHNLVRAHLAACQHCHVQLERYRRLAQFALLTWPRLRRLRTWRCVYACAPRSLAHPWADRSKAVVSGGCIV